MSPSDCLKFSCKPHPNTACQRFDDELIIIQLESGTYFSVNESGARIWSNLEAGHSPQELLDSLESAEARDQLTAFVMTLLDNKVITSLEAAAAVAASAEAASASTPAPEPMPEPWVAPTIQVYQDMQDLFRLDPIHDVDEVGWPSQAPTK